MKITAGVYESLISRAIEDRLTQMAAEGYFIRKEDIDSGTSHSMLADYLAEVVGKVLKDFFQSDDRRESIASQVNVVNSILQFIENEWRIEIEDDMLSQESQEQFLRGIFSTRGLSQQQVAKKATTHPVSGYRVSSLFTGGGDLSLDDEVRRDILTADNIDLVVSFIKFEGLRLIYDDLRKFVERGGRLRVLTTTYIGATDPKAVANLYALGEGNDRVEIRASYNTHQERLHAKAYIFCRNNGFDTAYIGSSNISRSALTKGLEWNMRVTSVENRHIINKTKATFDNYWNSDDFEPIDSQEALDRFRQAIYKERHKEDTSTITYISRFERKTHQIKVLEKLQYERQVVGSYKNLIIAATGTGKTAISAFDFKDFSRQFRKEHGRAARLLFVAHREKILQQARWIFCSVLGDANFGEMWTGNTQPLGSGNLDHLFITIQTLNNHWAAFADPAYYDYVVIDEAHHSAASSYRPLFENLRPKILMGLTATPERMDGSEIKLDFNNRFAAEIRLQEALNQQLLAPFDYFCVTDTSVDLSRVACRGDAYDEGELARLYCSNEARFEIIQSALDKYVNDPQDCKAVCFCCGIGHAEYMERMFNATGYRALAVTSRSTTGVAEAAQKLASGDINYLVVADMLNEGVDIPEIDTVLFLRPTESLTIFLQQLGRGLRLADGKTCLTVLDFIAQANKSYNYESRFRALVGRSGRSVKDEVQNGFVFLPRGCSITMEQKAQEFILNNIQNAIFNLRRLRQEVARFEQNTGRALTLENFLENFQLDWRLVYKTPGSWARLKTEAGIKVEGFDDNKYTKLLEGGLARLYHTNSHEYLCFLRQLVADGLQCPAAPTDRQRKFFTLFYYTVWMDRLEKVNRLHGTSFETIHQAVADAGRKTWFVEELATLVRLRLQSLSKTTAWIPVAEGKELELYGCYSADEIHLLLDGGLGRQIVLGTQYYHEDKYALVFVTLNKSDKEYSSTTRYEDYAISPNQFHWQSMNRVTINSSEGQRIIRQREDGWKFLLFVRDRKKDEYGNTNGYYCLGFIDYHSSTGERPLNVVYDMRNPIPGFILEMAKAI